MRASPPLRNDSLIPSCEDLGSVKLDGSTKQSDRMPMIDKFHQDPDIFVFLISTLAGGTGLNLTGANKVVIFGESWDDVLDNKHC